MGVLGEEEIADLRQLAEAHLAHQEAELGPCLGAGASAAVFEVQRAGERTALKVYDPEFFRDGAGAAERRRLELQKTLTGHDCPFLVQIEDIGFSETTCFVEMEYVAGLDLSAALRDIPRAAIQPLIQQLVSAVRFLEARDLVHRDIKPQNIKVDADFTALKLLDLGVIRDLGHEDGPDATNQGKRKPFIATAQYSSPEYLFWLHAPSRELWKGLSIYQVGAVLHDLLVRRPLFADEVAMDNRYALAMAVLSKVPDTHVDDVPAWLCALSSRCLTKDLQRRLAMVSWDDFDSSRDATKSVIERFRKVSQAGIQPLQQAAEHHRRVLTRESLMDSLLEEVEQRVREELEARQMQRERRNDCRVLSLKISKTTCTLDYTMNFAWEDSAVNETAAVSRSAYLRRDSDDLVIAAPACELSTLTQDAAGSTADAVRTDLIACVGRALDYLELRGEPELAVLLE
jgi:eukaryotic-like serine/threonine-protein kinase